MKIVIAVKKDELVNRFDLKDLLKPLISDIEENNVDLIYVPLPGNLLPILNLLREEKIAYSAHVDKTK